MEIRTATEKDISALAGLMEHLGYPTTTEEMNLRFSNIESHPDYHTLIASYNDKTVGMVSLAKSFFYEADGIYVRIVAIVVDPDYQNLGIGKELIKAAENWARMIGANVIALNSGDRPERSNAHTFYKNMGFEDKNIGFTKSLL
ncbi:GNAT family N-acetyltransferase [Salicibibacter cibarius]|uniref:GNAT family N-acetyltransferase n=1 Tax=Salicibibacter cibarius TaxID=2743000 RepID=A0A7T6Z6H2_9BACI|nr:GNAT family N-acetyltransferase [Salicibibacter cibarius]QQK77691.1 GNAT family N-acetyltransferase [Salicibibacter cibarius]